MGGGARRQSGSERLFCFFFQAEDGIRDLVRSRGLGDVYKRQMYTCNCSVLLLIAHTRLLSDPEFFVSSYYSGCS